jgi:PEP-CTERM motif
MMSRWLRLLVASLVVLSISMVGRAHASTIVYQQPLNTGATDAGGFSEIPLQQLAGEFVLSTAATVDSASWFGTMFSADPLNTGDTWNFDVLFYSDSNNLPGTLLQSSSVIASVVDTGIDINDSLGVERVYGFSATFSPLALQAGTSYWFSVANTGPGSTFRWTESTTGLDSAVLTFSGWVPLADANREPLNFALLSDSVPVPEPTSLTLLGLGLAGLGARRWRQRKP